MEADRLAEKSYQTKAEQDKDPDFKSKVSNSSCDVSQVQGFMFGGN